MQLRAIDRFTLDTLAVGTAEELRAELAGRDLDRIALYRSLSGQLTAMLTYGPTDTRRVLDGALSVSEQAEKIDGRIGARCPG